MSTKPKAARTSEAARKKALAAHLDCKVSELTGVSYAPNTFTQRLSRGEYLVLTAEEATAAAVACVKDSLWAFRTRCIADFIGSRVMLNGKVVDSLEKMQGALCEDANDLILALIGVDRVDAFAAEAIRADGRGHFLAGYDGIENAQAGFFIYRTN